MGQLEELLAHRAAVVNNIQKACNTGFDLNEELEKARHGVYADNAQNRRLNRVGKEYGSKAKEEQPKGRKQPSKEEEQGSYQKMATEASDNALKRAAADENADPKVRKVAQDELKKRSGGKDEGGNYEKEMSLRERDMRGWNDNQLKKVIDDTTGRFDDEDKGWAKDELSKRVGFSKKMENIKEDFASLIGNGERFENEEAFDNFLNYIRSAPESAYYYEVEDEKVASLIEAVAKEMNVKLPSRQKLLKQIEKEDEERRQREKEWQEKEDAKMAKDPARAIERSVALEWGEPENRKERAMMKRIKDAAKNFLKKNPELKLTMENWSAISEGFEDDPELQKLFSLEGYQELAEAIDKYVDKEE